MNSQSEAEMLLQRSTSRRVWRESFPPFLSKLSHLRDHCNARLRRKPCVSNKTGSMNSLREDCGDRRLRTLQLGNDWFDERPGGLNRVFLELIRHLPAVGVDVNGLVVGTDRVGASTGEIVKAFAPASMPIYGRLLHARRSAFRLMGKLRQI